MAMTQARISQFGADYQPYAKCEGDEEGGCTWSLPMGRGTTKAACIAHVRATGHRVKRVRESVTWYYLEDQETK